jgi:hypothetical protein
MADRNHYVVAITDGEDKTFTVSIRFAGYSHTSGTWRALSLGAIRHNSGILGVEKSIGTLTAFHLQLVAKGSWGIRLNDFEDFWSVNDDGVGLLIQPWVLGLQPGRIAWSLVE